MGLTIERLELSDDQRKAVVHFRIGRESRQLRWVSNSAPLTNCLDAAFATLLQSAMVAGGSFVVNGEVSARLLHTTDKIMDICHCWWPRMQKVRIEGAVPVERKSVPTGRVGSFFSCGVDSFHTFLERVDEIDDLILIHGFDVPSDQQRLWGELVDAVYKVAAAFGKEVIEVTTDSRPFHEMLGIRSECQSAVLSSVALSLAPRFRRVYIPSSMAYKDLIPWGSHPLLDPLWRTEQLEFIHHGCETNRLEKVRQISDQEQALRYLRPCHNARKPDAEYCCGNCEKCLRTMAELLAVGALDRCRVFSREMDLRHYSLLRLDAIRRPYHREILQELEATGTNPELQKAIRRALKQPNAWIDLMMALGDPKEFIRSTGRGSIRRAKDLLRGNWRKAFASWSPQ